MLPVFLAPRGMLLRFPIRDYGRCPAMNSETAFLFPVADGSPRPAILHEPVSPSGRGVLVVVGGPQYRVGSHRQFVLLARTLAARGIPVMRFDCRGMGDAAGDLADFTQIDGDIHAAIEAFAERVPGLREIVLWGLCDAASASMFHAWRDSRVTGLVLLNPWVRTEGGQARAYMRHYYLERLASGEFWRKLLAGGLDLRGSSVGFARNVRRALRRGGPEGRDAELEALSLPDRMAEGLARFQGKTLFILSGEDLTAAEFRDTVRNSPRWRKLVETSRVNWRDFAEADHTFSRREWRDRVAKWTCAWLDSF